jgi:hypothetical protein
LRCVRTPTSSSSTTTSDRGRIPKGACGRSHPWRSPGRSRRRTVPPSAMRWPSSSARRSSPGRGATVPGRSRSMGWSRPRSPTATPELAIPTCTPTSPSPTRCRRARASGCRSTARCFTNTSSPRARRGNGDAVRDLRQAHPRPGPRPQLRPCQLDRAGHARRDRRGRYGRHPHPGVRHRAHGGAGCVGAADRRRPSARRHRHWWTAARCRFHPRRNPAQRAGPVRRPRRGEASLSLRDGDRAALVFYLDNDRVHVGDVATCLPVGATA